MDCVSPVSDPKVTNNPNTTTLQKAETQPASYKHFLTHKQILDLSSCFIEINVYFVNLPFHSSREKCNHDPCF